MRKAKGIQNNTALHGPQYVTQTGDINVSGPPPQPPPVVSRIRVLMVAANPRGSARLAIDEEVRQISERLRLSHDRDAYELITCWAVRPTDLLQHLNEHRPHIVHFSGHGAAGGDLLLSGEDDAGRRVDAEALADLLRVANDNLRVVVLNACHSAAAIRTIGRHVDYLVGMTAPITDDAATIFAASFYSALGFGRGVPQAFDQAVAMLGVYDRAGRRIPELLARPGANPYLTVEVR